MYDKFTRKPKEPAGPERVDLGEVKADRERARVAEQQAAEQPIRVPMPPNPLSRYLGPPHRALLPSASLASEHDEQLAGLLEAAQAADGRAVRAELEWERFQPGGAGFAGIVDQDRAWARPFLDRGEEIPADCGPLIDWFSVGEKQLFVEAVHRRLESDHHDLAVRRYPATSDLIGRLDRAADELRDQIRVHLMEARNAKSQRSYDRAGDLRANWNLVASLHEWALVPTRPYRSRQLDSWPADLLGDEYLAATEGLNQERFDIPDMLVSGMPPTSIPARKSQERAGDVIWGVEGPPPR